MTLNRGVRLAAAAAVLHTCVLCSAGVISYEGSLATGGGGMLGTGSWLVNGPTTVAWKVSRTDNNPWHYHYTLTEPQGNISHIVLETSPSFTAADLLSQVVSGSAGWSEVIMLNKPQQGNPNMPDDAYGIKLTPLTGLVLNFDFDTWRNPVWGDFYAKDGNAGGLGVNSVWNQGFTAGDTDPAAPPSNGSVGYHLLVPDSNVPVVPEPTTLFLLGCGCAGILARRRRT